jgi:hypothetical protein
LGGDGSDDAETDPTSSTDQDDLGTAKPPNSPGAQGLIKRADDIDADAARARRRTPEDGPSPPRAQSGQSPLRRPS